MSMATRTVLHRYDIKVVFNTLTVIGRQNKIHFKNRSEKYSEKI